MLTSINNRTLHTLSLLLLLLLAFQSTGFGQEKEAPLQLSREIEKVGERQYMVTVTVRKVDLKGYAKLEEMIPEGFVASKEKGKGSSFVFQDGKAKFIWMEIPSELEFEVVYKLIQKQSKPGTYTIDGRVSCVSGDGELLRVEKSSDLKVEAPKKVTSAKSPSEENDKMSPEKEGKSEEKGKSKQEKEKGSSKEEASEAEEESKEEGAVASKGQGTSKEEKGKESGKEESKKGTGKEEEKESGDKQESSEDEKEGIAQGKKGEGEKEKPDWEKSEGSEAKSFFSVQIGAFGEKKNDAYFKRRYGLESDEIRYYKEGDLHKYRTGRFQSYEQAQKEKKRLRKNGLKGAFVVGFKEGKRVSASRLR